MKRLARIFALLMAASMLIWMIGFAIADIAEEESQEATPQQIEENGTEHVDAGTLIEAQGTFVLCTHSIVYDGPIDPALIAKANKLAGFVAADTAYFYAYELGQNHLGQADTTPHTLVGMWTHMRHDEGIQVTVADYTGGIFGEKHDTFMALYLQDQDTENAANSAAEEEFHLEYATVIGPIHGDKYAQAHLYVYTVEESEIHGDKLLVLMRFQNTSHFVGTAYAYIQCLDQDAKQADGYTTLALTWEDTCTDKSVVYVADDGTLEIQHGESILTMTKANVQDITLEDNTTATEEFDAEHAGNAAVMKPVEGTDDAEQYTQVLINTIQDGKAYDEEPLVLMYSPDDTAEDAAEKFRTTPQEEDAHQLLWPDEGVDYSPETWIPYNGEPEPAGTASYIYVVMVEPDGEETTGLRRDGSVVFPECATWAPEVVTYHQQNELQTNGVEYTSISDGEQQVSLLL